MKKQSFTAVVWQEWDRHVAQCLEIDVSSYGTTHDEALQMLKEAIELAREDGGDNLPLSHNWIKNISDIMGIWLQLFSTKTILLLR